MISLENLLLFVPLAAILVMLPGPDFALIAKISLLDGRPQGQAAACGVALGIVIHTSAAMLGISAIIAQSVFLFSVLKYIGAAYLFWLGVQALRQSQAVVRTAPLPGRDAEENPEEAARPVPRPTRALLRRAFKQGLLTNILNPKAVLIFLTFLPQFMNPHMPLAPQFLELGGIMSALCLCWYVPLAYMLGHVRKAFESSRFQQWLQRCTGVVFIAFGLKLAAAHND
ncbi:LysE family translocator [Desulfovibrio sp. PG-178-WT-4]|uniref:LysE family translocator n=1 Tax=Desulfovibrio porci TaxID=2605782 RepID=A0A6L5XIM8_9BACT|nr:LysE family translocator [Desulfovibrio porci]MDY3809647.1 LysE family translocator [Desulfovibrio porci]MSS26891.1 LysE family translocator [Desulfovibrio porci]